MSENRSSLSEDYQKVITHLKKHGTSTREDIAQGTNLSKSRANQILRLLDRNRRLIRDAKYFKESKYFTLYPKK